MAAKTAQERGGLRQATQLVGAGAPGRLQRDVLRQYAAFRECHIRVCGADRVFRSCMYQNSGLLLSHTVILGALEMSQGAYLRWY